MADKNTFFGYKENQASTGYGSAILYKEQGDSKYRFLCASETVPFPFGDKETFEFNLLNSRVVGQVAGKNNLEQKSVELLFTRDNAFLFETLTDKVLDFMSMTSQGVGYKYSGTISFRPNDASNDIHRGTYVITPMDADPTPYYTAREEVLAPLFFADVIPDEVSLASLGTDATTVDINVSLRGNIQGATYKYDTISTTTNKPTGTQTSLTANNGIIGLPKTKGLYIIYAIPASETTHSGCFTTVYITD